MTVREAVERLAYGERFYLKGSHSGKILYHSVNNNAPVPYYQYYPFMQYKPFL